MSRIPPVENIELPLQEGPGAASMATLFQVMAHRPELARYSIQLLETAMRSGTVDPKLKELLAVRVSQVNHCFY
jgi:alkylhydroperoxidase family enzyme